MTNYDDLQVWYLALRGRVTARYVWKETKVLIHTVEGYALRKNDMPYQLASMNYEEASSAARLQAMHDLTVDAARLVSVAGDIELTKKKLTWLDQGKIPKPIHPSETTLTREM